MDEINAPPEDMDEPDFSSVPHYYDATAQRVQAFEYLAVSFARISDTRVQDLVLRMLQASISAIPVDKPRLKAV